MRLDVSSPVKMHGLNGFEHVTAVALNNGPVEDGRRRWNGMVAELLADQRTPVHGVSSSKQADQMFLVDFVDGRDRYISTNFVANNPAATLSVATNVTLSCSGSRPSVISSSPRSSRLGIYGALRASPFRNFNITTPLVFAMPFSLKCVVNVC